MAKIIKNIQVAWGWTGDTYALRGFNIMVLPSGQTPTGGAINAIASVAKLSPENRSYSFNNTTLDTGVTYVAWVQSLYDDDDSAWVNNASFSVADDGLNTLSTKSETTSIATAKADTALSSAQTFATTQANTAQTTAISTASADATSKANTALTSAQTYASTQSTTALNSAKAYADAQIALEEARANAYADGIITTEEQARINALTTNLADAKAYADAQATTAKNTAISTASTDATAKANTAQSTAISSSRLETYKKTHLAIRYIRDWSNGSTANADNHWLEIKAIQGVTNVAQGKTVTTNGGTANLTRVTDGVIDSTWAGGGSGLKYVQVDLGSIYYDIDSILVARYYVDGRTYYETKTEVSSDGVSWYPIFDSLIEGRYVETSAGKLFAPTIAKAEALFSAKLTREQALAYADGVIDAEESARISAISSSLSTAQAYATTAETNAKSYASTQASTAQTTAISTASADATSKANTALSTAQTYASAQASTAQSTAISTASADATAKTNTALATAKTYAVSSSVALNIDNATDTLFHFDSNISSTNGVNPDSGYDVTLEKNGGLFGGAVSIEEATVNIIGNGCFQNGAHIDNQSGSYGLNEIIKYPNNPMQYISEYVLRQGNSGVDGEYEVHAKTGQSLSASATYTMSCWVYYSPDWNGNDAIFHLTHFNTDATNASVNGSGALIKKWNGWEYRQSTFTTTALSNGLFNWYIGYNGGNTAGHRLITGVQLEKKSFATSYVNGARSNNKLGYSEVALPTDFTMMSNKRHMVDASFTNYAVTKSGSTFKFYKNGVVDTSYSGKWATYKMKDVAVPASDGLNINKYSNPIEKFYVADPPSTYHNWATSKWGILVRTFVYASANVTVWHRYSYDNYGGVRVNNVVVGTGAYGWEVNPDVRIDLKKGWNCVEIFFIDGDSGGGLALMPNSQGLNKNYNTDTTGFLASVKLSSVPEVLYMTAEMPIEFSAGKIYFNEKSNCLVDEMLVSNRVLTDEQVKIINDLQQPFYDPNNRYFAPRPKTVSFEIN